MDLAKYFSEEGIVPVIKMNDAKNAERLAETLLGGGLKTAEITFRSDAAEETIARISKRYPEIFVCAGTVLTVENAKRAVSAGAKAIVSPGIGRKVVEWCLENEVPVAPGCATPSDIQTCIEYGLDFVKIFPAEVLGGVNFIKALAGPFGFMKFMPTGGVTLQTLPNYLAQRNVVACGGTWIVPERLLANEDFEFIEDLAHEAAQLCASIRRKNG